MKRVIYNTGSGYSVPPMAIYFVYLVPLNLLLLVQPAAAKMFIENFSTHFTISQYYQLQYLVSLDLFGKVYRTLKLKLLLMKELKRN